MPDTTIEEGGRGYRAVQVAAIGPLLICGVVYLLHPPFRLLLDEGIGLLASGDLPGLRQWGAELGAWAALATTLLMIIQALAAPIPAVLVTATNSWLFGWIWGGILSIVAATLAATICYVLGRACGEPLVNRLTTEQQRRRSDALMSRHGVTAILVARLLPFVPFDPISYLAGAARMPLGPFVAATLVGQVPAGMTYSYLAGQLDASPSKLLVLLPGALIALAVLGWAMRHLLLGRRDNQA